MNPGRLTEQEAREVVLPTLLHPIQRRRVVGAIATDAGLTNRPMPGSFGNGLPGTRAGLVRRAAADEFARQQLANVDLINFEGEHSEQ